MTSQLVIFRAFFFQLVDWSFSELFFRRLVILRVGFFFRPPNTKSEKNSHKSTNKKILAKSMNGTNHIWVSHS